MLLTWLAILLLSPVEGWESKFFEDVRLTGNGPPATVQVAWLKPQVVWTSSEMACVVSVFEGAHGKRKLVSSTSVGTIGSYGKKELVYCEPANTAFLVLPIMRGQKLRTGIFAMDSSRPVLVLEDYGLGTGALAVGIVIEHDRASNAGVVVSKDDYPDPPVEREMRFDKATRKFVPGQWRVVVFNPPSLVDMRGANGGHSFRLRIEKQNFKLGNRQFAFDKEGNLTVNGQVAYGTDRPSPEDIKDEQYLRQIFMTEIVSFRAWIDDREIEVPQGLWNTCFNANLETEGDWPLLFAWLSADGTRLVVKMLGSDAAGGYIPIWTIRANGKHSREFGWPP